MCDVNRDGRLGFVSVDARSNRVDVLPGNGDGTLGATTDFPVGIAPIFLAAADLDRDGNIDLALPDQFSNTVSVLLKVGLGALTIHWNGLDDGGREVSAGAFFVGAQGADWMSTAKTVVIR